MYEQIKKFILCFIILCFCACQSTRTDEQVLEYQRQIDRLEDELRARDRTIVRNIERLEAVTSRSSEMGTDIDAIIRELDDYQQTIERILSDYRKIEVYTEDTDLHTYNNATD